MLADFYDKTAEVKRLAVVSGAKQEFTTHIASIDCLLQPMEASIGEDREGAIGKNSLMMCATADIKENDVVIIDATEYRVMGIEKHALSGQSAMDHMELILRANKS